MTYSNLVPGVGQPSIELIRYPLMPSNIQKLSSGQSLLFIHTYLHSTESLKQTSNSTKEPLQLSITVQAQQISRCTHKETHSYSTVVVFEPYIEMAMQRNSNPQTHP